MSASGPASGANPHVRALPPGTINQPLFSVELRAEKKGDIDLKTKLAECERCYNFAGLDVAFNGMTPYEALGERL